MSRRTRLIILGVGVSVVCLVWFLHDAFQPGPPLNVVLLVIDTCRADHLSCYGYERTTTPRIDSLASSGVQFTAAYAQAPWTLPSFASLLTSQYPSEHRAGGRFGDFRRFDIATRVLPEELLEHGYATAGIANVTWLEPKFRFSKGFQIYDYFVTDATNTGHRIADVTTTAALAAIDRLPEPFFLMVHYFDPHVRYEPPSPHDVRFTGDYDGPYGRSFGGTDEVVAIRRGELVLDAASQRHLQDLYDGELSFTDEQIGVLLAELRRRELAPRTLVVVTADHGEEFWEHGGFEHGHSLYEDQIHVPLILSAPGLLPAGKVVQEPVRQIDIAPTILDLLGFESPIGFRGSSLCGRVDGSDTGSGMAYAEAVLWGEELECVRIGKHKLIRNLESGAIELYDIESDPGERQDLAASAPEQLAALQEQLERERGVAAFGREAEPVELDEKLLEQLRSLGYTP